MSFPVIKGVAYCLAHAPSLVRYGSKTSREIAKDQAVLGKVLERLRSYQAAVAYPPHQVYVGNLRPDDLRRLPRPWYDHPVPEAGRFGPYGEIMPEAEFYGLMKIADEFNLVFLEEGFTAQVKEALARHPLIGEQDLRRLGVGVAQSKIEEKLATGWAVPLYVEKEQLVGCLERGHDEDESLTAPILLENLACKASAILVVRHLLQHGGANHAAEVGYILNCGEEAVGDRYTVRAGRQEFFTLTLARDPHGEFIVDRQGLLIRRTRRVDLYLGGIFDEFVFELPEDQPDILKVRPLDIVLNGSPI